MKRIFNTFICLLLLGFTSYSNNIKVVFCGSADNDLYRLMKQEGFAVARYASPTAAINAAVKGAAVFIVSDSYPSVDTTRGITEQLLKLANEKQLKLYVEYPAFFPNLSIPRQPVSTILERGVITSDSFGGELKPMSVLGINNCHVLRVTAGDPLIVLAKVVGFDKAEYGLANTRTYPLLFREGNALVAMTGLSHFAEGRYGPFGSMKQVWTYILSTITGRKDLDITHWPREVAPMYERNARLPRTARANSIKKGVQWFFNGRFFVDDSWRDSVTKYAGDGTNPFGPPVGQDKPNGDGRLGILEGHASTINYDGSQQYRYWMRADVQGEASMALAAAGSFLKNRDYNAKATNLIDYMFITSNMRAGAKSDPNSAAYGLIGWATTHPGVFYGDDNARAILGAIAASAYLRTDRWDKELAEAIMANFRTTGKWGFRGERLEEKNIIRDGWKHYEDRELFHPSPHFESWMWACYLWLYDKTKYEPLLTKTKEAIRRTMEAYPSKWLWGSSMQTQRARMILPLAWLLRIEPTDEHKRWLEEVTNDLLSFQVASGAIQEQLGEGKGRFRALKSNEDYGTDEGSLIFRNGEPVSCLLYTCNFAIFSLHEAAKATGNKRYDNAVKKLSDFLTRVQVKSDRHKDLDGAWFRAFDYGRWDYWASNSDWGWGAWCTLTGWIQSWIVTTQVQIEQGQSYWDLTQHSTINRQMKAALDIMYGHSPR